MDDFPFEEVLFLIHNHQENVRLMLKASNDRTLRRIRRSRRNLQRAKEASFARLLESYRSAAAGAVISIIPRFRTVGRKERSANWWFHDVLHTYDNDQWLEDFPMSRETFFELVNLVAEDPDMAVSPDAFVEGLSVEQKVAIAVYRLASCGEYRTTGKGFGVHKSTVCVVLHTFCKVLIRRCMHQLLYWPNEEECSVIARSFEEKHCLPNVLGAIDGSHIPITPTREGAADFRNRKNYHSLIMQAVVDHRMLFRDVTAQHPGCNHDASVLRDSYLYRNHDRLFPHSRRELNGINDGHGNPVPFVVPHYLIGDPAYPLSTWIMKNYSNEMNEQEASFNLYLNNLRIIVEHAFGRLKGRWRILCKTSDLDVYNMPHVIVTCAMLHNFLEMNRQPYRDQWDAERLQFERQFPQPQAGVLQGHNNVHVDGELLRDHLCAYMALNFPLKTRDEEN